MKDQSQVPGSVAVMLARLFGTGSTEARATTRSPTQWKKALRRVDEELLSYLESNIHTDPIHETMLHIALDDAEKALETDDFWPAYSEAIIRLALFLMGDYPDHRARKTGVKRADHYDLRRYRTIVFTRDPEQKHRSLYLARALGASAFDPRDAWYSYRGRVGRKATRKGFMRWYREKHPGEYAKLF
jgi:hypothetical protein